MFGIDWDLAASAVVRAMIVGVRSRPRVVQRIGCYAAIYFDSNRRPSLTFDATGRDMATARPSTLDTLLFVDTNVLLDFYRIRKSDINTKYLEQLEACRDRLIIGSQVEMEYKKNRQRVIVESLGTFSGPDWNRLTPPALVAELQATKMLEKHRKQLIEQQKRLNNKITKILGDPIRCDPVYQTLQRLFKYDSPLNLSRDKKERFAIRNLARKRFVLGYPPRKSNDTSIGSGSSSAPSIQVNTS